MSNRSLRFVLPALLALALAAGGDRKITDAELAQMKQGKVISEVKNEGGTQSGAWSAGLFNHPPALMWKVVCSLESYPKYMARNTVSKNIDEGAKDRLVAAGDKSADEVEKLFADMKPGYVKKQPDGKWTVYSYQRNSFPWPVNDKWILLEITHDDKTMTQTWHRLAGNIKEDHGSWHFEAVPSDPQKTVGINDIHIDLDIPATGPFTAFAMDTTLPDTYKAFEKMAVDLEGKK
jgi:hypothetical protein